MAITTANELLRAGDIGRCELIAGELRMMMPPGFQHGRVAARLTTLLLNHADAAGLGTVTAAETGFLLAHAPDTVRAPDVAFVRSERVLAAGQGYFPGAPDLAVEVLSPNDRPGYVREKVAEWLEAGAQAVWVVDPRERTVTVHEAGPEPLLLGEDDLLSGGPLLPGFEIPVRDIFG